MKNYLAKLNLDELKYICEIIPTAHTIKYFTKNPKKFGEIKRGFRPNKISEIEAKKILVENINNDFIASFVNKTIDDWLLQINKALQMNIKNGESENGAYLKVLPESFFSQNVALFFKLCETNKDSPYIELISNAVSYIHEIQYNAQIDKTVRENQQNLDKEIKKLEEREKKLFNKKLNKLKKENNGLRFNLNKTSEDLKCRVQNYEQLQSKFDLLQIEKSSLIKEKSLLEKRLQKSENMIAKLKNDITEFNEEQNTYLVFNDSDMMKCLVYEQYNELDNFKEDFKYNLKSINVKINKYGEFLIDYIGNIIFLGRPILVNTLVAHNLISCINNSLIGTSKINSLIYDKNIETNIIVDFLKKSDSVVCLENFIGNYNETELITICSHFRNKIIFLSYPYERTLNYVSDELINHCEYVNLNRIIEFTLGNEITEEPRSIKLKYDNISYKPPTINTKRAKKILDELQLPHIMKDNISLLVNDLNSLCSVLMFYVIPYFLDVKKLNPFSMSATLQSFVEGPNCSGSARSIIEGWFESETIN